MRTNSGMSKSKHYGTTDSCSFCGKQFGPDYSATRKHIHYVFRLKTRIGIFYGPTHGTCISRIQELRLPGVDRNQRVTVA